MGSVSDEQKQRMGRVAMSLYIRNYNREVYPLQSKERELTPVEYTFLAAYEFSRQIYINGYDGFRLNTGGQYADYLPVALAAIGAHRWVDLARKAASARRHAEEFSDKPFIDLRENLDPFLYAYFERHRDELPGPEECGPEALERWEAQKRKWSERNLGRNDRLDREWAGKERTCPKCSTTFTAKFNRCACPKCRHVFFASHPTDPDGFLVEE